METRILLMPSPLLGLDEPFSVNSEDINLILGK